MKPKQKLKSLAGLLMCLGFLLQAVPGCSAENEKAEGKSNQNTSEKSAETSKKSREEPGPVLTLFAAAGTRAAVEELAGEWKVEHGSVLELNFASSGTLARQIEAGAEPDVYISANRRWIDYLLEKKMLDSASVKRIAANALALIVPKNSNLMPPKFTADFPIASWTPGQGAVGDPAYVPVGRYTKAAWQSLGWWESLQRSLILGKDVSSVLRYVELGEADWGVVYRSEAMKSKKVKILQQVPENLHKPIRFYVGELKTSREGSTYRMNEKMQGDGKKMQGDGSAAKRSVAGEQQKLRQFIHSPRGVAVFLKHGFLSVADTVGNQ